MKRKLHLFVSISLISVMIFSNAIIAFSYLNVPFRSTTASDKFNAYLQTLEPAQANAILQDEQLVYMMTQDSYWEPKSTMSPNGLVSLPLSDYGNGTYYTVNGSACSCHSGCTYVIPSGMNDGRCYNPTTETSGNCIRYRPTGSIQCKAFADYVFCQYTGNDVSDSSAATNLPRFGLVNGITGQNTLNSFMQTLTVGSNVRMSRRDSAVNHSFIITAITDSGISLYDCNGTSSPCKVRTTTQTWEQLVSTYDGVVAAWRA